MFPYIHFPGSVLFVDDDVHFMNALVMALDVGGLQHKILFDDPMEAFRYLQRPETQMFTSHPKWVKQKELFDFVEEDFSHQISVAVVDFHMPEMNGLDFLSLIDDPNVQKILLTGMADEKMATQAFNQGLIHQYYRKQDKMLISILQNAIFNAEKKYFAHSTQSLQWVLQMQEPKSPLLDPVFCRALQGILNKAKKYCLLDTTGHFALLNSENQIQDLWVTQDPTLNYPNLIRGKKDYYWVLQNR